MLASPRWNFPDQVKKQSQLVTGFLPLIGSGTDLLDFPDQVENHLTSVYGVLNKSLRSYTIYSFSAII